LGHSIWETEGQGTQDQTRFLFRGETLQELGKEAVCARKKGNWGGVRGGKLVWPNRGGNEIIKKKGKNLCWHKKQNIF